LMASSESHSYKVS